MAGFVFVEEPPAAAEGMHWWLQSWWCERLADGASVQGRGHSSLMGRQGVSEGKEGVVALKGQIIWTG